MEGAAGPVDEGGDAEAGLVPGQLLAAGGVGHHPQHHLGLAAVDHLAVLGGLLLAALLLAVLDRLDAAVGIGLSLKLARRGYPKIGFQNTVW